MGGGAVACSVDPAGEAVAARGGATLGTTCAAAVLEPCRGRADEPRVDRHSGDAGSVLLIFPLGLVPFSNTLPAWAILLLAAGLLQRDGLLILLGYLFLLATVIYFGVLAYGAIAAGQGIMGLFR